MGFPERSAVLLLCACFALGGLSCGQASRPTAGYHIAVITFVDAEPFDEMIAGFRAEMARQVPDSATCSITVHSAQGDGGLLLSLVREVEAQKPDLVLAATTPVLQAVVHERRQRPVLFTFIDDPVAVGVTQPDGRLLPNVTGVLTAARFEEIVPCLRAVIPGARRIGALFSPTDAYSVFSKNAMERIWRGQGIDLVAVPVFTSSEAGDAARTLFSRDVDAICQFPDAQIATTMPVLVAAASRAAVPVFVQAANYAQAGAVLALGHDFTQVGKAAAAQAVRLMRGEPPASVAPVEVEKQRLEVNLRMARTLKLAMPPDLIARADTVIR